jgi:hypothetical protein
MLTGCCAKALLEANKAKSAIDPVLVRSLNLAVIFPP